MSEIADLLRFLFSEHEDPGAVHRPGRDPSVLTPSPEGLAGDAQRPKQLFRGHVSIPLNHELLAPHRCIALRRVTFEYQTSFQESTDVQWQCPREPGLPSDWAPEATLAGEQESF